MGSLRNRVADRFEERFGFSGNALFDARHEAIWRKAVPIALYYGAMGPKEFDREADALRRKAKYDEDSPELIKEAMALHKKAAKDAVKLLRLLDALIDNIDESVLDASGLRELKEAKRKADFIRSSVGDPPKPLMGRRELGTADIVYLAGFQVGNPVQGLVNLGNIRQDMGIR
jgi:hypothetical protein